MKAIINKKTCTLTKFIALNSIFSLFCVSSPAFSGPLEKMADQWYIGGSLGMSSMDPDGGTTWKTTDSSDFSKKIYVGTDISRQIGLEAFWADFGGAELTSNSGDKGKITYSAVGANLVYNSPLKFAGIRPLGKLGVAKFSNKDSGAVTSKQSNKLTVFGGIGAEFDLTKNLTLRSEYEYFDKDISQLSLGLNWSPRYRDHSFISRQNRVQNPVVANKVRDNVINVYVPEQVAAKPRPAPRPVVRQKPKPRVAYRPAPAPAAPKYKLVHKTLSGGSHFGSGSDQLTLGGRNALNRLAQDLNNQTIKSIKIVGHTDSIGSHQSNLSLSYARANSVAAYLSSQGVNRQIVNTQGLGETKPVADNRTDRGRALNRRVEITVKSASRIRIR